MEESLKENKRALLIFLQKTKKISLGHCYSPKLEWKRGGIHLALIFPLGREKGIPVLRNSHRHSRPKKNIREKISGKKKRPSRNVKMKYFNEKTGDNSN